MDSFRLAHTFAAISAACSVCAVAAPIIYHDWTTPILWLAAALLCAWIANMETREVRGYRRHNAQIAREQRNRQFYADATRAENKQGLS